MISLTQNICKSSKKCLKSSTDMIRHTSHQYINITNSQNNSFNGDLPVTLERNPFEKKKQECILCRLNIEPDYKNVRMLSQFQSSFTGRIYGRHITGLCKAKQGKLEREILKAQNCGFMPVYNKAPEYLRDPKLFDSDNPFRPHKF